MRVKLFPTSLLLIVFPACLGFLSLTTRGIPSAAGKTVAITFDDLPFTAGPAADRCTAEAVLQLNHRILDQAARYDAPLLGFVVENQLCPELQDALLEEVLTLWLEAGHELGNHTFNHPDFNRTSRSGLASIVKGDEKDGV